MKSFSRGVLFLWLTACVSDPAVRESLEPALLSNDEIRNFHSWHPNMTDVRWEAALSLWPGTVFSMGNAE